MADEAVLVYETEPAIPVVVANANALEKGTVLAGADLMVGAASSADNDVFFGITKYEKIASDGTTAVAAYFGGVFKMTIAAGQSTTIGQDVVIKGANTVGGYSTLDDEKGYKIGKAMETGAAGETVLVFVGK
jgi:hypothetical protein